MYEFARELIHAGRMLRRERRFALVAIVTIAVGIAATTTMITVVRQVLLAPLPYAQADHIAVLNTQLSERRPFPRMTGGDFVDLRSELKTVEAVAHHFGGEVGVQLGDRAAFVPVAWTTGSLFRVFSIVPSAGRLIGDEAVDEAVVNEGFAVRTFGAPTAAVGRRISIENRAYTIVGVVPAAFHYPRKTDIWLSTSAVPESLERTAYNYQAVALARADVSVITAQQEVSVVAGRLAAAYPASNREKRFVLTPLREYVVGDTNATLYLLLAAVIVLLLIACVNVANLEIARGIARGRELAIRGALGADRWALARTAIAESMAVGVAGAFIGAMVASVATSAVARWAPADLPRAGEIRVDWLVWATAAVLAVLTGIVSGVAPARHAARLDLGGAMREEGERTAGSGRTSRVRQTLVTVEIGLAFVLALTATLLIKSVGAIDRVDLGFRPENVLVMYAHEPARSDAEYDRALTRIESVVSRTRALPGVRSAAAAMGMPAGRYGSNGSYAVEGRQRFVPGARLPQAIFSLASPGYFATMGIRLERGRDFSAFDRTNTVQVAILSESAAREQFGDADPLGHRVMCGLDSPTWMTIVGVVSDVRHSPGGPAAAELYMPLAQHKFRANEVQIVVRTAVPPDTVANPIRTTAAEIDPNMAVSFTTMEAMLQDAVATPRVRMMLIALFGAIALLLAASGVYAVMSYAVLQRTKEFAVRAALGATRRDVIVLVIGVTARMSLPALIAGAVVAMVASGTLKALLFGVAPLDPLAYATTGLLVLGASLAAAAVPAWRAMRVDPAEALRAG